MKKAVLSAEREERNKQMKKIINNRLYDTDTAKYIGSFDNMLSQSDFHYCREELYKKKTGEFFLYGSGGAMSIYSKSCGDGYMGSEKIIPLTEEDAKEWVAENCNADTYIELFGCPEE